MRKSIYLFLFLLYSGLISSQELQPLPDCKDIKEKITAVSQSFDKLLANYKDKKIEEAADYISYSSAFNLCDKSGELLERKPGTYAYSVVLYFKFQSTSYKTDLAGFRSREQQLLKIVKEVFGKWQYQEESEENKSLIYYSFIDKKDPVTNFTKRVNLNVTHMADYSDFTLTFAYYNY